MKLLITLSTEGAIEVYVDHAPEPLQVLIAEHGDSPHHTYREVQVNPGTDSAWTFKGTLNHYTDVVRDPAFVTQFFIASKEPS